MQLDPASGWCHGVQVCPSPNFNERPAGEVSLLVIHNISLPPAQFATGNNTSTTSISHGRFVMRGLTSSLCSWRT